MSHRILALASLAGFVVACAPSLPPERPLPLSAPLAERLAPVTRVLDSAIADGAAPGAVLAVSVRGERFTYGTGVLGIGDSTRPDAGTMYDMASLTKVIALTTLSMMAIEEGKLRLDVPVVSYLPDFGRGLGEKGSVTVRDLLLHDSGLPAHRRLWEETFVRKGAILRAITSDLNHPPGEEMVYSDLGAITLTAILEKLYGKRIDKLFHEKVAVPLGMVRSRYLPPRKWDWDIAPTENDPWRGHIIRGEVHDENAAWMDGVSGHAGLFSTADDLLRFTEWALAGARGERGRWAAATAAGVPDLDASTGPPRRLVTRHRLGHAVGAALLEWHHHERPFLRPYRLHRHLDLGRRAAAGDHHPAHQPGPPDPGDTQVHPASGHHRRRGDAIALPRRAAAGADSLARGALSQRVGRLDQLPRRPAVDMHLLHGRLHRR